MSEKITDTEIQKLALNELDLNHVLATVARYCITELGRDHVLGVHAWVRRRADPDRTVARTRSQLILWQRIRLFRLDV